MNYTDRNKLIDSLCGVGLMLLLVEVFYGIVDSAFTIFNYNYSNVTMYTQMAGGLFLLIAIIVLIRAYKKDNMSMALYGIELVIFAISAAILPNTYLPVFSYPFNKLNIVFPFAFLAYYIIKALVIAIRMNKKVNKSKGKKK